MPDHSPTAPSSSDQHPHGEVRAFGPRWWEEHYRQQPGPGAPSPHLAAELSGLPTGTALDAGCGTGADAVWLAREGWEVTAVDVSPTVVDHARRRASEQAAEAAAHISWVVADLTDWHPPHQFDLVVSQYVHPDAPFGDFVAGLARWVAPGGTLLIAGHDHADSHSAAHAPRPASVGPDVVVSALGSDLWDVDVAETRTRTVRRGESEETMHDLVVRASRKALA